MFFSIIIPLYNRPNEIDELLLTLTQQTYTQFEVLVIEDGSINDAKKIVEKYKNQLDIKYYFKENEGQGFSRNYGFQRAKGEYFIVFDSDCLTPKSYLEIVKNHLFNNWLDAYGGPDGAHKSFTPVQKAISYSMTSFLTTGGIRGNKKHVGHFHPRSFNMGISREVWEKTGGYILTRLGEDIEFSIRINSLGFKIGLIPCAMVYHKRRTDFIRFYKQLHFFGRARINIYKYYADELKIVHFLPALFTFFLIASLIINILNSDLAAICNFLLAVYIIFIFFHSWIENKSAKVAFLSIIAVFVQLTAYGLGFTQDFFRKIMMNKNNTL
ncbi:MAG: glycosyltransferase [Flavobacterium sp.]|nr:glycosyltransferase [Pedobacter sp.]